MIETFVSAARGFSFRFVFTHTLGGACEKSFTRASSRTTTAQTHVHKYIIIHQYTPTPRVRRTPLVPYNVVINRFFYFYKIKIKWKGLYNTSVRLFCWNKYLALSWEKKKNTNRYYRYNIIHSSLHSESRTHVNVLYSITDWTLDRNNFKHYPYQVAR